MVHLVVEPQIPVVVGIQNPGLMTDKCF